MNHHGMERHFDPAWARRCADYDGDLEEFAYQRSWNRVGTWGAAGVPVQPSTGRDHFAIWLFRRRCTEFPAGYAYYVAIRDQHQAVAVYQWERPNQRDRCVDIFLLAYWRVINAVIRLPTGDLRVRDVPTGEFPPAITGRHTTSREIAFARQIPPVADARPAARTRPTHTAPTRAPRVMPSPWVSQPNAPQGDNDWIGLDPGAHPTLDLLP